MPAEPSTSSDVDANPLWGDDWPEVRALWPLEPTVAHLNHGSYGAVPTPVLEEQQSWRDRMETNPLRFLRRELPAALVAARAEVAGFLGAGPTSLAFVHNATSGASTVLAASRSSRATRSCSPTMPTAPSGLPPSGSRPTGARGSTRCTCR